MPGFLHRLFGHHDPREGEVCRHLRERHVHIPDAGYPTYEIAYDACLDCDARWGYVGPPTKDPKPGPYKRRNWRWVPVSASP